VQDNLFALLYSRFQNSMVQDPEFGIGAIIPPETLIPVTGGSTGGANGGNGGATTTQPATTAGRARA
jgi:hypothetical protein